MDVASLTLSIIALYPICCEGYKLVCSVKSTKESLSLTHCKFQIQQARFLNWGRSWGLSAQNSDQSSTAFEARLAAEGITIVRLLENLLNEMSAILSNGDKLQEHYGLASIGEDSFQTRKPTKTISEPTSLPISKDGPKVAPDRHRKITILRRLTWSIKDKERFIVLANDLKDLNDGLYDLLPVRSQLFLSQVLNAEILSSKSDPADLQVVAEVSNPNYPGLEQASKLKSLNTEVDQVVEALTAPLKLKFSMSSILSLENVGGLQRLQEKEIGHMRSFARFCDSPRIPTKFTTVIVEWKPYDSQIMGTKAFALARRVDGLARLLNTSMHPSERYNLLHCLGFVDDLEQSRFGFIFQSPRPNIFGFPSSPRSLNWIIGKYTRLPPLETRFHLATSLARTLFQFHCAEWLHKDFSSFNIFFASKSGDNNDPVAGENANLEAAFLLGFSYSRPEDHEGLSSELRTTDSQDFSLYQHPRLLSVSVGKGPRYCKTFDIYGLGCVLLEIGLWRRLKELWKPEYHGKPEIWKQKLVDKWVFELRGRCGSVYEDVVRKCLAVTEELETSSIFCWEVLEKLEGLKVSDGIHRHLT